MDAIGLANRSLCPSAPLARDGRERRPTPGVRAVGPAPADLVGMETNGRPSVRLSVLIPSRGRPDKLDACLASLARQDTPPTFEVLVGLDGGTRAERERLLAEHGPRLGRALEVHAMPRSGYIPVRRSLFERARGEIGLSLNDDVVCDPRLLAEHDRLHRGSGPEPAVIAGRASWAAVTEPTLFDAVVQRSDLLFFDPARRRGAPSYRECYGLNMSAPVRDIEAAGGVRGPAHGYGYDDIELAWRLVEHRGARIIDGADARVVHDHRHSPRDVMRREYLLGRAAWDYAGLNPAFSAELHGRSLRSSQEVSWARSLLRRQRRDAERVERTFLAHADRPWTDDRDLLSVLAEHWLPLKRYLWAWGLLDAADGVEPRWSALSDAPALPAARC